MKSVRVEAAEDSRSDVWAEMYRHDRHLHDLGLCVSLPYGCPWCEEDIDIVALIDQALDVPKRNAEDED